MWYVAVGSVVVVVLALALAAVWLLFAPGPRRGRAVGRARRSLEKGEWREALRIAEGLTAGRLPPHADAAVRTLAGEARQSAADDALKQRRYEEALDHHLAAAALVKTPEADARSRVVESMLAEMRRLFAAPAVSEGPDPVVELAGRLRKVTASPCPEAWFWEGLCHYRRGETDEALASLTAANELAGKHFLDPSFYLGAILHRLGRPQEALRSLGDANRLDPGCPFVTWQMGLSLVAAGGDCNMATRALQRALGPRGFPMWAANPERAWVEAFPEGKSYIRRMASKHRFVCPVLGGDLGAVILQGRLALAQALYRDGKPQEAADLFTKLMQETAPTPMLLRGLGLSLAKLERYDLAYKHLRTALEQENPKDPFTAGYLALCGALGKPTQAEDKPKNVAWAIRLLDRFPLRGDAEWAAIHNTVFAEARALGMETSIEDETTLCEVLASVHSADAASAAAYAHFAAAHSHAVKPVYAWLYARAAAVHGVSSERDLDLFARTFLDSEPARAFFAERAWDFSDVEYTYLQRSAAATPGRFPEPLGTDYPQRGERFLLDRSKQGEAAGRKDAALQCVEVLLALAPASLAGHDRLAALHYRRGDLDRAAAVLADWSRLHPADHWPQVRRAIVEQQRGGAAARAEAVDRALGLTRGPLRGAVAFLGAKLALLAGYGGGAKANGEAPPPHPDSASLEHSRALLIECLKHQPDHAEALWTLAAVRSVMGDRAGLAAQAPEMDRPAVPDARFHYLGAVCCLAAGWHDKALELSRRAAQDRSLTTECHYVEALAHLHRQDEDAARQALVKAAGAEKSPSAVHAKALLGQMSFGKAAYDDAVRWWKAVEPRRREEWKLDEPLRQTVLLAGLAAYEKGRFELAAERIREAGRLGLRDRRLGSFLTLALVKAGQRLLFDASLPGVK
jgi:tetratricopeptide (TPR) repeat protein